MLTEKSDWNIFSPEVPASQTIITEDTNGNSGWGRGGELEQREMESLDS